MYLNHWRLEHAPFGRVDMDSLFYPGESHQGAALKLRYVLDSGREAAALAGPPGVGKTLIVERLIQESGEGLFVSRVVFPRLTSRELLALMAGEIDPGQRENLRYSADESLGRIQKGLAELARLDKRWLLVVDEAHLLEDGDTLESIRLLLNLNQAADRRLSILLIGQMPLVSMLLRSPSLDQRMSVKALVRSFTPRETAEYVTHRLVASGGRPEIFTPQALESVHACAAGTPRRIDRLCDLALLVGYAEGLRQIDAEQIEEVNDELVVSSSD